MVAVGGPNNSTGWAIVVAFIGTGPMPIERLTRNKVGTDWWKILFYCYTWKFSFVRPLKNSGKRNNLIDIQRQSVRHSNRRTSFNTRRVHYFTVGNFNRSCTDAHLLCFLFISSRYLYCLSVTRCFRFVVLILFINTALRYLLRLRMPPLVGSFWRW